MNLNLNEIYMKPWNHEFKFKKFSLEDLKCCANLEYFPIE